MKKAQIGMMETIAILIVFTIMISIGTIFYVNHKSNSLDKQAKAIEELRWTEILTAVQTLPEIQCNSELCGKCSASSEGFSYDLEKIIAASDIIKDNLDFYYPILKSAKIQVDIVDPRWLDPENEFLIYNISGKYEVNEKQFPIPALVYDPVEDDCYLSVLRITIYSTR